jgi:1-acyl-sn-glycerol-3-phosphate acyltransferase
MNQHAAKHQRSLAMRIWYDFLRRVLNLIGVLAYGLRYSGRENIPATGAVLVCSNHQSHFDPPLVGMGCVRRLNYLARESLFQIAPLRLLIQTLDAIPIDREGLGLSGIKESLRRLKRGEMVLIFPEGTRTTTGEVQAMRPGFTVLAVRGGAAILPVGLDGPYQAWPKSQKFPRLGTIHIHYGQPLLPEEISRYEERELLAEVERRIRECHAIARDKRLRTM